ncbi:MAG: iron chelate uptake ABC transporter family permease subunit, partial [Lachnospiraceae bacterium]|nr:iron chelate uptake ABC transporter family permease subunit [Lachnospiraceae bacterium]
MIILAFASGLSADTAALSKDLLTIVPSGLKEYIATIITEVQLKSRVYVPVSFVILVWSASKVFHALTNGLNVISKVGETRGWFFLRFRSILYVILFLALVGASLALAGAVLQTVLRNPLADPFVLGLSGGASLAAAAVLATG